MRPEPDPSAAEKFTQDSMNIAHLCFRSGVTALLSLVLPSAVIAQTQGIHFESGLSWVQIKAKAKAENKFIFMDCYTTWCAPCKYMTETVFPSDNVGAFFNPRFVSVAIQMDRTLADS